MRSAMVATLFTLFALAISGCAVAPEADEADDETDVVSEAVRRPIRLEGAYRSTDSNAVYLRFVFRDDLTYFADRRTSCGRDLPCIVREEGAFVAYGNESGTRSFIELTPNGGTKVRPRLRTFARASHQIGGVFYTRLASYCEEPADCRGQIRPTKPGRCVDRCVANLCDVTCTNEPPRAGSSPGRSDD
jgi:hypothetical protein